MLEQVTSIIGDLGKSERSYVEDHFLSEIESWARIIDEIYSYNDMLDTFPDSKRSDLNTYKAQFEEILNQLRVLDITADPNSIQHLSNRVTQFRNSYYYPLFELLNMLRVNSLGVVEVNELKKTIARAKKEQENFQKSFEENLQKQASGSTKTLAKHFDARLKDLKATDETNPKTWLEKRHFWGKILGISLIVLMVVYILGINQHWFDGYEWQVAIVKLAFLALIYSQYHFSTKNYHIYADLVAQYEHMAVISKTVTDFIASAYDDSVLKENILSSSSKTLFSELKTGHSHGGNGDSPVLENIMNNWPKNPTS